MPVLDGLEETAMICVGGTRDVVVMVRGGSVGRLGAMLGAGSFFITFFMRVNME